MKHYGLLGEKLSHSYSSKIHTYVYQSLHLDADYSLIECKEEELSLYIQKLRTEEFHGFNVTIPFKKTIMKYLDALDSKAEKIGSVNTVYLKDGKVIGTNTDYDGFLETIRAYFIDVFQKECYILGTGGASLAVFHVLKDLGGNCHFVSRTPKENSIGYQELDTKTIDILVNTTPVGMYPNMDVSPVSSKIAKKAKVCIDIIFNPYQTKLLQEAKSSINGLYMLIMQAIKAEEIWQNRTIFLQPKEIINFLEFSDVLPEKIWTKIKNLSFKKDRVGRSEDTVYQFEDKFILKISSDMNRLLREKEKVDWLVQYIPGPKSIEYQEYNSKSFYLRTCLNGESLLADRFLKNPKLLIQTLSSVVAVLRSLDDKACPFSSLDNEGNSFVHGDLCLPNIYVNENNEFIGFIDLDNAGIGDCWYDYAWLFWSFTYNLKTKKWNNKLEEALGLSLDENQYNKYIPQEAQELLEKMLKENG